MGAGNTAYRLGRLATAEDAYRRALSLNPDYAPAHNNLAQVHLDRGNLEAAEAAARAAVKQGGPLASTYRQTLNEILEAQAGRGR
jgi:tetratricopeptide (TPR) repeat protein